MPRSVPVTLKSMSPRKSFDALDIGEDNGLALLLDQTHSDTGNGALQGHATVHKGKAAAAGGSHGRRTVGFHDLGDHANSVGELVFVGQNGKQSALGKVAVTDLATLGATDATGLARAEGQL